MKHANARATQVGTKATAIVRLPPSAFHIINTNCSTCQAPLRTGSTTSPHDSSSVNAVATTFKKALM